MYYFDNPEKTPFNFIMGDMLDQREYFRDYHLTQKGKLLWDQIHMLKWYGWILCSIYDYTCCSRMNAPHLPFSCKFNDNETSASYANDRYDFYDVERIEEFVAFKGAYEIESLFEKFQDFYDSVYRAKFFAILKYCYDNYKYNYDIDVFIEKVSAVQEETNILQEFMEEEIDDIVSRLDEKDDEESEEQKEEEWISYRAHLIMRVTLQLVQCLMSLRSYRRIIAMIPLILLKYPFLMNLMLAMLMAKMPV